MILLELFLSFFQIGLFSIGGGYAAMPLIQHQVVDVHAWLTMTQFADIIAIAEMTPGPIAINTATFVGIRIAGFPGVIVATLGCILPSSAIVMCLGFLYYRFRKQDIVQGILGGLRLAVIAMIASAAVSLLLLALYGPGETSVIGGEIHTVSLCLFAASFVLLRWCKISPMPVMIGTGLAGMLLYIAF